MTKLLQRSKKLEKSADKLLTSSKLPKILREYGEVNLVGSYAAHLMAHGDIDIHITRPKPFSKNEVLGIFNEVVKKTKFNSYYIGDWNSGNLHPEFPDGYYLGFKTRFAGERWKIDVWLISKAEQEKFDRRDLDISKITISPSQRETILQLKDYRNKNGIKISGQKIYEMVLNEGVKSIRDFKKLLP